MKHTFIFKNTSHSFKYNEIQNVRPIKVLNKGKDNAHCLLDSLVVECWRRVREVPTQGPRHTRDVIKMVLVVPLLGTQH